VAGPREGIGGAVGVTKDREEEEEVAESSLQLARWRLATSVPFRVLRRSHLWVTLSPSQSVPWPPEEVPWRLPCRACFHLAPRQRRI